MLQKLKTLTLSISSFFLLAMPLAFAGSVSAVTPTTPNVTQDTINGGLDCGSNGNLGASSGCDISKQGNADSLASTIINILSVIVGVIAVIMIIVAGLRYITSGGKQESVTGAKNTILYAVIGLVIVAVAQVIVHFVLNKASGAAGTG